MAKAHHFRARTVWTGADRGSPFTYEEYSREFTVAVEGKPTVTGSAAGAFRGDESLPNPEDMLLAAVSACHLLSYLAVCARSGIEVLAYEDECTATLTFQEGRMQIVEATLRPVVTVAEAGQIEGAARAHVLANAQCFIASSVRFPVRHEPTTLVASIS